MSNTEDQQAPPEDGSSAEETEDGSSAEETEPPEETASADQSTQSDQPVASDTRDGFIERYLDRKAVVTGVVILAIFGGLVYSKDRLDHALFGTTRAEQCASPGSDMAVVDCLSIWTAPPQIFAGASNNPSPPNFNLATVSAGQAYVFTPKQLVQNAVEFGALPIYVVGRIAGIQQQTGMHDITAIIHLVERDPHYDAYVATDSLSAGDVQDGQIIYALGRVAAVGATRSPNGNEVETGVIYAVNTNEINMVIPGDPSLDKSIAAAIRQATGKR